MVEERDHHPAALLPLIGDLPQVHRDGLEYVLAGNRLDGVAKVDAVHVNRPLGERRGDLFRGNEQELAGLFEQAAELGERLEPDLLFAGLVAGFDPSLAEAARVFAEGPPPQRGRIRRHPLLAFGEQIVIRQREEIVAVLLVPVGDHFGEVVAIGPEGVRVEVPFPVAGRCVGEWQRRRRDVARRRLLHRHGQG